MTRLLYFLALSSLICTCGRAQGVVVEIVRAGIGTTPDMDCRNDLAEPDCRLFNGVQEITVAPGAEIALFMEWRNSGTADIVEVTATNEMGNIVFGPITSLLVPTQTLALSTFFTAPTEPGEYATLVTLTAESDVPGREDTDQFRYFINVDQALPVELSKFTAMAEDKNRIRLVWTTAQEINNDRFLIERSANGNGFQQVGAVAGASNGQISNEYIFHDTAPLEGLNFYRLRQIDVDGSENLSEVVSVRASSALSVFPNPGKEELTIVGINNHRVDIFDGLGRLQLSRQVVPNERLDVSSLSPGMYLLRVDNRSIRWNKY